MSDVAWYGALDVEACRLYGPDPCYQLQPRPCDVCWVAELPEDAGVYELRWASNGNPIGEAEGIISVPEPSAFALFAAGLLTLAAMGRKR
jgi:hypothetical protein